MNKDLAKTIGRAAREARTALQLTQEDAAERIHVSVEFYARIERGKSLPSIGTFARIVSALGVSADALLGARPPIATVAAGMPALWTPPSESPEMRRLSRRLRKARPATLRLVSLLVKEIESAAGESQAGESEDGDSVESRASEGEQAVQGEHSEQAAQGEQGDEGRSMVAEALDTCEPVSSSYKSSQPRSYAEGRIAAG
ncbi:helix-turn-helix domain-containing protein [Haliangium ochraceum]|uniref:Transcriptional regulator, XRE family n=1 Tax=Haliangium ochraceum (strain DSM 14365 / JCM 11303 / SMP-2) TaxID=502025 RepID=D0LUH7_HALO1|nr:helix-turn-helix domain-containing protein [Haliangium ochraceum]ACY19300.1 transcriptional regulator, XRE family [Haliangium ochraceum DSM 14365]